MPEMFVSIPVEDFTLEALMQTGSKDAVAVLCHPHPLYGGTMHNNVVSAMQLACSRLGWSTLRFNFRGVGRSGGRHAQGEGEVEDVRNVVNYLKSLGYSIFHWGGYSYGAWVLLKAVQRGLDAESFVLVSPPLDFLPFESLNIPDRPCLVTAGNDDLFCSVQALKSWLSRQTVSERNLSLEFFPLCDHFYLGREKGLTDKIFRFLDGRFNKDGDGRNREPND